METKTDFKIQKVTTNFDVVGQGKMITEAYQNGEWYLIPASEYKGKIPPEVLQNLFRFLNSGIPYQGFIIAEDMRVIRKKEEEAIKKGIETLGAVAGALAMGMVTLFTAIISLDPMLIAVCEDGSYLCLGTWYE